MTRRAQASLGAALVVPVVVLTIVFLIIPLGTSVYYTFVDFDGISANPPFVGLGNIAAMFGDAEVLHALGNNLIWIVIGTICPIAIGLFLALLLWTLPRGGSVYRLAFFLPFLLPGVAIGIVWGWIYDPLFGWLNQALRAAGLEALTRGWLGDPATALVSVLATAIWSATGFVVVIFLAALRNVDTELVDAARIDGATSMQRLRYVLLPQIMPVFLMVLTLTLVGGFSVFDIIFVMTGGGPAMATNVIGTYAYTNAFTLNRISYGTTLALLITALAVPCAILLNRLQRRLSITGTSV